MSLDRRIFLRNLSAASVAASAVGMTPWPLVSAEDGTQQSSRNQSDDQGAIAEPLADEGLVAYILRVHGQWDITIYRRWLGAANEFKEGDQIVGVAATSENHRRLARKLLGNTRLEEIDAHPPMQDNLYLAIQSAISSDPNRRTASWTLEELKAILLKEDESAIRELSSGLSSDVIGNVVKLMSNDELKLVGNKVFHPLPGSNIGAKGYLGARIQPNSPTDLPDDIRWQVFCGWSYAVGDVLLGTNPVSSEVASVAAVEAVLSHVLQVFGLATTLPHCVLAHIDVQAEVERQYPGSTALWFQSIAGSDSANATFDVSLEKMLRYAEIKGGPFGLYFETGQGADFTNGHSHGFDMVLHESRKYGFARLLSQKYAQANALDAAQNPDHPVEAPRPWVHLNDVAGFIGPEVFRSREQLVRCCLEDIVMGKLHGLCIGLDVCSTLHMDVSLDDLDWCLDQLAQAGPAYLMALPTKIDPMLGYLTTGFQDHVRLRERYGLRVNDAMWKFFQELQVIDEQGRPTSHFGDPNWVYLQYRRRLGDPRTDDQILAEGRVKMSELRQRGVFLATGFGDQPWDLRPELDGEIRNIYSDAKRSIWAEFDDGFERAFEPALPVATQSASREDYILHPVSGEQLSEAARVDLKELREAHAGRYELQIIVSDGLNALAITDREQLLPFLSHLRSRLAQEGYKVAPETIVVRAGRVRAGYQIGELLFGDQPGHRGIIHVIGERPGTGHRTFSAYFTSGLGGVWGQPGSVDHDRTRVVAGIANTALMPGKAAEDVVRILGENWGSN